MAFKIKRIYEDRDSSDGWRVLVDRIWPRGVSKEEADLDEWYKELAPTSELREWFGHIPEKFEEFTKRYDRELDDNVEAQKLIKQLREKAKDHTVTLLYGAKDTEHNQAVVLKDYLEKRG